MPITRLSDSPVELTDLVVTRMRSMARLPLLLATADALFGLILARGWNSPLWLPGTFAFGALLAANVWGLADRALSEWHVASEHRSVRMTLRIAEGVAGAAGIGAAFLFLCSMLLLFMGTYFR